MQVFMWIYCQRFMQICSNLVTIGLQHTHQGLSEVYQSLKEALTWQIRAKTGLGKRRKGHNRRLSINLIQIHRIPSL